MEWVISINVCFITFTPHYLLYKISYGKQCIVGSASYLLFTVCIRHASHNMLQILFYDQKYAKKTTVCSLYKMKLFWLLPDFSICCFLNLTFYCGGKIPAHPQRFPFWLNELWLSMIVLFHFSLHFVCPERMFTSFHFFATTLFMQLAIPTTNWILTLYSILFACLLLLYFSACLYRDYTIHYCAVSKQRNK